MMKKFFFDPTLFGTAKIDVFEVKFKFFDKY